MYRQERDMAKPISELNKGMQETLDKLKEPAKKEDLKLVGVQKSGQAAVAADVIDKKKKILKNL